ncbi:MAG: ribosome-associated translation inhibitor RaiA [Castellaniella sp.]|uniref:ribosome hibernation-promoting factor, HPF/YfiA family n=1 Tax=Castellaniella sp. TaxID=1955812 RepID=UPI00122B385E|nr:ribosome-associated translation inhibitor RaiA [Castellaniella sp.]TAN28218.1 MAG: ribosome-associated translation inhibitor RaiA [Castellaniella sp.]
MSLTITGRHLEITPAIREYVYTKTARVLRHFDQVIDSQVMLSVQPLKHTAEMTVRLRGKDLHCEASDDNLYAAIDLLVDKVDRQIIKYKSKAQTYAHEPPKRQAEMASE